MAVNQNSPFGMSQYRGGAGGAPTFALTNRKVLSTAGAIYQGDPVQPNVTTATGFINQGTASTIVCSGIFDGCNYLSTSQKRVVWSNYWPGSDATGDVNAKIIDDPNAQFVAMGNSTDFNITGTLTSQLSSPVGQYCNYTIGTGNTANGISGAYLSGLNTTVTLPFIVVDLITAPPGSVGSDPTTAYNWVVVGFNNEWLRTNGAGPLGIT